MITAAEVLALGVVIGLLIRPLVRLGVRVLDRRYYG